MVMKLLKLYEILLGESRTVSLSSQVQFWPALICVTLLVFSNPVRSAVTDHNINETHGFDNAVEFHNFIKQLVSARNTRQFTTVDEHGETVLHKAVKKFPIFNSTLEILNTHGLDFNAINNEGDSAFFKAVQYGRNISFLTTLISYGMEWTTRNKNNDTALHVAVLYGNLPAVKLLLSLGSDVNAQNSDGRTPLHQVAVSADDSENMYKILTELANHGANENIIDKNGDTLLILAYRNSFEQYLRNGNVEVVEDTANRSLKLKNILDELEQLKSNSTDIASIFQIVQTEDLDTIKSVLDRVGKSIDITEILDENLHSLLHVAIKDREYSVVEYLVNVQGFFKKLNDTTFSTQLIELCLDDIHTVDWIRFEDKLKTLQLLFRNQPKLIDSRIGIHGRTPLHLSTSSVFDNGKQLELIQMLIDNNANVNATDEDANSTALHLAVYYNPLPHHLKQIIRILIENHLDANAIDKWGETFLHKVAGNSNPDLLHETVEYLDAINNTNSFTTADNDGKTVLHFGVYKMEVRNETLEIFQRRGVDFNATVNDGDSILHFAISCGRSDSFLENLMAFGADWRLQNIYQETSLHIAALWDNLDALKLFIKIGADVNAVNIEGHTPLHYVFWQNDVVAKLDLVNELINHGADVSIKSKSGEMPIDIARLKRLNGMLEDGSIQLLENAQNQSS